MKTETKGLDAILTKDQELQKQKILEELMGMKGAPGKESKPLEEKKVHPEENIPKAQKPKEKKPKKPKNDTYKYFKVVEASFDEKPKQGEAKKEQPKEAPKESPVKEDRIPEPPLESLEEKSGVLQETAPVPEIRDAIQTEDIDIPPTPEMERAVREEAERAERERAEEERKRIEEEAETRRKQEALYAELEKSKAEYASKMTSAIEKAVGTTVTPEEAERLESEGNVYRKTILISREVEERKEEPQKRFVLRVRKNEREIPLVSSVYTIGRKPECDISFPDENYIGRTHAKLTVSDKITIQDLNSKNGTFVNGKKIDSAIIGDGDIITFANVDCILRRI